MESGLKLKIHDHDVCVRLCAQVKVLTQPLLPCSASGDWAFGSDIGWRPRTFVIGFQILLLSLLMIFCITHPSIFFSWMTLWLVKIK
jgi:hypothetical protein